MLNELQAFLKTPLGAALADQFTQRGNEDLKQVFAAGDEMVFLLDKVHTYMEKADPAEAREFARAADRVVQRYKESSVRYRNIQGTWKPSIL